jgi:hypothetical protein
MLQSLPRRRARSRYRLEGAVPSPAAGRCNRRKAQVAADRLACLVSPTGMRHSPMPGTPAVPRLRSRGRSLMTSLLLVQGGSLRRLAVGPRDCRYGDRVAAFSASGQRAPVPGGTGEARAIAAAPSPSGAGSATTAQATAVPFAVTLAPTSNTGGRPAGNVSPDSGVDDLLRTEHEITCRTPTPAASGSVACCWGRRPCRARPAAGVWLVGMVLAEYRCTSVPNGSG